MKAWSAALAGELRHWPQVTQKSFFGFTAVYRDKTMFALLPRTRNIFPGNGVAFRFPDANLSRRAGVEQDSRVGAFDKKKRRWFTFELSSNGDLHDALDYLGAAYEAARSAKKTRSPLE